MGGNRASLRPLALAAIVGAVQAKFSRVHGSGRRGGKFRNFPPPPTSLLYIPRGISFSQNFSFCSQPAYQLQY